MPTPCASIAARSLADTPAAASARSRVSAWAAALGALRPSAAPAWLSAVPSITPWIRSPSARARSSGLRTRATAPSPRTIPSLSGANGRGRPDGDSSPARATSIGNCGVVIRLTPATSAIRQSPRASASTARCSAASPDAQARSTVIAGPSSAKPCDSRAAMLDGSCAESDCGSMARSASASFNVQSPALAPTNTPVEAAAPSTSCGRPASARAAQACSSSKRCCGSIRIASRADNPNSAASNRPASATKPARMVASASAPQNAVSRALQRPAGNGPMPVTPAANRAMKAARLSAPGSKPAMPTIATLPCVSRDAARLPVAGAMPYVAKAVSP